MGDVDTLTLDQVAAHAEVHYQTVYRWVRAGTLPAAKVDGSYRVRTGDLDRFLEQRRKPTAPPPPARPRILRQREAMTQALLDGDETKARSIANQLLSNGTTVTTLIEDVIVPPLRHIGTAWHNGELPIYVEHRATAIVQRLLGEITPNPRGRRRGTAAVAALSGDLHSLPTTMATAALREDNWHVEHLGADVPIDELVAFATANPVDLMVISVTYADRDLAESVKKRLEDDLGVPTIVGWPGATLGQVKADAKRAGSANG